MEVEIPFEIYKSILVEAAQSGSTVEEIIEQAFKKILSERGDIDYAGR